LSVKRLAATLISTKCRKRSTLMVKNPALNFSNIFITTTTLQHDITKDHRMLQNSINTAGLPFNRTFSEHKEPQNSKHLSGRNS